MDKAFGILLLTISPTLCSNVATCNTLNEVWTTMENLFGKQDEMQAHIVEYEINYLDPNNFENIQDFFMKFK